MESSITWSWIFKKVYMKLYEKLPSPDQLGQMAEGEDISVKKVNGHFHTPYSFSAFSSLEQVLEMARDEQVDVLGINDFYTMAGYDEFAGLCAGYGKFPMFNIEFMGLLKEEQAAGIRVNDPNNPGRTYFSGKGLDFPVSLSGESFEKLRSVREESDRQTRQMVEKASAHLVKIDEEFKMDYDEILEKYTRGMVRERHIARVIRTLVYDKVSSDAGRRAMLERIYDGKKSVAPLDDPAAVEGEIRSMLLKSGGVAFVREDPKAFLEIPEVIRIIIDAGGIPCYPVLLDDKQGNYTEYEANKEVLYDKLTAMNVYALELIPGRNRLENLRSFVEYFHRRGFVITFGTEHNTPSLDPLTVSAADAPLDDTLERISYEGACITAAHQYFRSLGEPGFTDRDGRPADDRDRFIRTGNLIINHFVNKEI